MNDPETTKTAPTAGQMTNAGFMIATAVVKTFESSNISSEELKNFQQETANEIASEVVRKFFKLTEEKWFEEKKKISLFWKKFFNVNIDWSKNPIATFDPKFKHIEFCPKSVACEQIFQSYAKTFGKDKVYKYWEKALDECIKEEQSRPNKDYVFAHVGGDEPDGEHLNKSYDDAIGSNLKFMTLKEGLISAFRYRFETGKMYDIKGVTRLATLDSVGNAMFMFWDDFGRFFIFWYDRGNRNSDSGPREVSF